MLRARTRLRSRLRAEVASAILDAAEELFTTQGVHHTQMTAIARKAGVAVGTLYNYHVDRDALVTALFETRRAALLPRMEAVAAAGRELAFEPRLRALIAGLLALFDTNRRFLQLAFETEHIRRIPPGGVRAITTIGRELEAIVDAGIAAGAIDPEHRELAPRLINGAIKAAVMLRLDNDEPMTADAGALCDLVLHGVAR